MASTDVTQEFADAIESLKARRQELVEQLEEIDATFEKYGIAPGDVPSGKGRKSGTSKRGRKKGRKKSGRKKGGRRKRRKYDKTAVESVLDFVKEAGNPTTAEINEHWDAEGRGGKADNTITKLVKEGKLERENREGKRGSRYKIA